VLLHGGMGDAQTWDLFGPILATRYRVIALDARGHGESDWSPDREYTVDHHVADVVQLLAILGCQRASLAGASLGGWTAYNVAALYPHLVDKLVIVDVSPEVPQAVTQHVADSGVRRNHFTSFEEALTARMVLSSCRNEAFQREYVERNLVLTSDRTLSWRYDLEGMRQGGVGSRDPKGQWRLLEEITAPTLLLRGADSPALTPELAQRMSRAIRRASLVEIPGAGHPILTDQPALFLAAIVRFLFAD